ncbi:MAG: methyltransferase, partial [Bradyrhizobium sp.]
MPASATNCGPMTRAFSSEVGPGSREENASKKQPPAAEITEDGFLGGQLRLRQPRGGHRAGHDAILLAAATPARSGDRVVDLGAGVGAAGLSVARRVRGIDLVLVEIDPAMAELARNNAGANAIMAEVVILDVEADAPAFAAAGLAPD